MLSRDATVAFSPEARVSTLAISKDGNISVWSEGQGIVFLSRKRDDESVDDLVFWKADGKVTGTIISNDSIFVLDEIYGINCLNTKLEPVWKIEIEGGGFEFKELKDRFAVIDSLGRLQIVSKNGDLISFDEDYSSISKMDVFSENIITAHENGEVRFKTEAEKGKKPTVFQNFEDFQGFVSKLAEYQGAIHKKAELIRAKRNS